MKEFEILDISGDVGLKAFGESRVDAFISAAIGMYSLITNLDTIEERQSIDVSLGSGSLEGLLVSWLNELIFRFDAYGFIGKRIVIKEFPDETGKPVSLQACELKAVIYGEEFNHERHEGKLLIKAATYHRLKVERRDGRWEVNVIFDI
jgi:SHS2 domain-containing protein